MTTPAQALKYAIDELVNEVSSLRHPIALTADDALEYVDADIISAWFVGQASDPMDARSRLAEALGESVAKLTREDACDLVAKLCVDPKQLGEVFQNMLKLWVANWLRAEAQYRIDNYDPSDEDLSRHYGYGSATPNSDSERMEMARSQNGSVLLGRLVR